MGRGWTAATGGTYAWTALSDATENCQLCDCDVGIAVRLENAYVL
jgi:hypothetical protein